jgi:hypothetical protein
MEFAELTQEVEVARARDFGFQEGPDGLSLTPGRRRAAKIYEEVRERLERELASVGDGRAALPKPPGFSIFFDPMPSINVDDNSWVPRARNHFEIQCQRRRELLAEAGQKRKFILFLLTRRTFLFQNLSSKPLFASSSSITRR